MAELEWSVKSSTFLYGRINWWYLLVPDLRVLLAFEFGMGSMAHMQACSKTSAEGFECLTMSGEQRVIDLCAILRNEYQDRFV